MGSVRFLEVAAFMNTTTPTGAAVERPKLTRCPALRLPMLE
jgi:hypothetical protein